MFRRLIDTLKSRALDVVFDEDCAPARKDYEPVDIAFNLIKTSPVKASIKGKRKLAA